MLKPMGSSQKELNWQKIEANKQISIDIRDTNTEKYRMRLEIEQKFHNIKK